MNKVCLVGRLTKDPTCEYVNTSNGSVARSRFTVAVNRPFGSRDENGNNSKADFISVTAWRNQAENLSKYQKKGNQISIEGRLQVDNYTDKNGNQVWNTYVLAENIQFLDKKGDVPNSNFSNDDVTPSDFSSDSSSSSDGASVWDAGSNIEIDPEDLPFY